MLEDLQTQVVVEGKAEAKTYDKFACFCKDMTAEKTDAINAGTDKSADLSALIEQLTNDRSEADDDINDLNKKIDELDKSMKENKEKRAAEKATFDARHAVFMGDAMGHGPKHQKALAALLQQDPEVPM